MSANPKKTNAKSKKTKPTPTPTPTTPKVPKGKTPKSKTPRPSGTAAETWDLLAKDAKFLAREMEKAAKRYGDKTIPGTDDDDDGPQWELITVLFQQVAECLGKSLGAIADLAVFAKSIDEMNG